MQKVSTLYIWYQSFKNFVRIYGHRVGWLRWGSPPLDFEDICKQNCNKSGFGGLILKARPPGRPPLNLTLRDGHLWQSGRWSAILMTGSSSQATHLGWILRTLWSVVPWEKEPLNFHVGLVKITTHDHKSSWYIFCQKDVWQLLF